MDFIRIRNRMLKTGPEIYPDFVVGRVRDLMIRGGAFYAVWDEEAGLWSTDELVLQKIVDDEILERVKKLEEEGLEPSFKTLSSFKSRLWGEFIRYTASMPDMFVPLDSSITFMNSPPRRDDYASKRLPYSMAPGPVKAYSKLMGTLYDPDEREKLEWAVGSVIAGDSKDIQKFIVLYGAAGTGKSTFLNILSWLFEGYWTVFDARLFTDQSNLFSSEIFRTNSLVAIQHDGDLSHIKDNTRLSQVISHEMMLINEKFKSPYPGRANAFLFIGSNQSVRISDAKSGIIRRLIDVHPTGKLVPPDEYQALMTQIRFELGAIAQHCLGVYRKLGKYYYDPYRPVDMIIRTDIFYNYLYENYDLFREQDGITLKQAWNLYKEYCMEAGIQYQLQMHRFRDELKNYFETFSVKTRVHGAEVRSWFAGFKAEKLGPGPLPVKLAPSLVMENTRSLFDDICADCPAQYANEEETPVRKWADVATTLRDIDTSRLHYVKPGPSHIVIDFDLTDDDGEKSLELNLEAASGFPPTYSEYSKGGAGVHLHYIYEGDVSQLSRVYSAGIEVKVFTGDSSLRRKLTKCNGVPVAVISSGLPVKEKRMIEAGEMRSERALRNLILRNLRKEIHPGTKPSIDFIKKILDDAYKSGMPYDVSNMRNDIIAFANNSSHHALYCLQAVQQMKFASETEMSPAAGAGTRPLVFYDVEVFPNLLVVGWKPEGDDSKVITRINPGAQEIEELISHPLIGFNNRRYDNHILWARMMGYTNHDLFMLSQKLVKGDRNAFFGDAYNLSYADIYDFSSKKQSLKRFQIELGLSHQELGLPWDEPVPEELWMKVAEYCGNDVVTTEQVFADRKQDYVARQILAELSGLTVNDTTPRHIAKILFGNDKHPQEKFIYTDLSGMFPGYSYEAGKSTYRDEEPGEGGYVYAEPGMYSQVAVLDVASMHPTSIEILDLFGPYTKRYADLKTARILIKRKDYGAARRFLNGALAPFLASEADADALAYALKIILNTVYGLTHATFDSPFRDLRNKDNIVAKRGALFMIDLKKAVQEQGFPVAHIKTDSVKIPEATDEIIEFVKKTGADYGYEFELEVIFGKLCIVNDAVYVGKVIWAPPDSRLKPGEWKAIGAQFAHPYVFKTLFSREKVGFRDLCETKSVTKGALYLEPEEGGDPHFVGRAGSFVPVMAGTGGGTLLRGSDGVFHSAAGAKGYFWKEAEVVRQLGQDETIDMSYFSRLANEAASSISRFGDLEWFTS